MYFLSNACVTGKLEFGTIFLFGILHRNKKAEYIFFEPGFLLLFNFSCVAHFCICSIFRKKFNQGNHCDTTRLNPGLNILCARAESSNFILTGTR